MAYRYVVLAKQVPDTENITGAGGVEQWTLKSIKEGETTVAFEYVRPWEKDKPPIKRRTFLVTLR